MQPERMFTALAGGTIVASAECDGSVAEMESRFEAFRAAHPDARCVVERFDATRDAYDFFGPQPAIA